MLDDVAFVDIHCHPTLPALNRGKPTLWFHRPPPELAGAPTKQHRRKRAQEPFLFTESDFVSLAESGTRIIFAALYPLEQGFVEPPALEWLSRSEDTASGLFGELLTDIAAYGCARVSPVRAFFVRRIWHSYFDDLGVEYARLNDPRERYIPATELARHKKLAPKWCFRVAGSFMDIEEYLAEDPNTIAVVPTVEGGHALGCGSAFWTNLVDDEALYKTLSPPSSVASLEAKGESWQQAQLKQLSVPGAVELLTQNVVANIGLIKMWGPDGKHAPFFITLSHHFWNQLCGHSISFATKKMNKYALDQRRGMLTGFTELGKLAVLELLSRDNGRRILIDTKHMTLRAKAWYFSYVEDNNWGPTAGPFDLASWYQRLLAHTSGLQGEACWIPIISSHSALSGRARMTPSEELTSHEEADAFYGDPGSAHPESARFNPWEINLSDEEVIRIFESGGIIGINMDQRILAGHGLLQRLEAESKKATGADSYGDVWAEALVQQLLRVGRVLLNHLKVKALLGENEQLDLESVSFSDKDALADRMRDDEVPAAERDRIWSLCAIGSDFDGMINPLDAFATALDFPALRKSLCTLLEKKVCPCPGDDPILEGASDDQIADVVGRFVSGNALRFLETYYTDTYRKS